jgi:hypothetical protein
VAHVNLSSSIVQSLKMREMGPSLINALLSAGRNKVLHRDETDYWDYKRELRLETPSEIARTAKDVLAFHNTKGGLLVVGVDDDYRVPGIPKSHVLDTYQLQEKLRKYIGHNIHIFQNLIDVANDRVLWLIFITKREGLPVSVGSNGPQDKSGRNEIRANEYYIRLHDQSILCKEPAHFERLFTGASIDHLQAYLYDVDEPYFRLLAPNCDRFFGRRDKLAEVHQALTTRHPVVALDGLGGVGKTAIAIELTRQLYKSGDYLFIVSQSAKSKVWHDGYVGSRRAGFSGLREFLLEVAKVLQLPISPDTDELKKSVIDSIAGSPGILLVDNIEDVYDDALLRFLSVEIPEPVKVLVTSRIDRGLGALTVSVPQMKEFEAQELLYHELERSGYTDYLGEEELVDQLLAITGCVPLALKWAAALAASLDSLKNAVSRLQKIDAPKREFLNFSFATMFDALPPLARDAALLCPYIGEDWNPVTVSMILDEPESDVERAIEELKDRGILMASGSNHAGALCMLPLTKDFLASKFKENKPLHDKVDRRIADLFASPDGDFALSLPRELRIDMLHRRAEELRHTGNFDRAAQMIRLALKWATPSDSRLQFLKGRILYESGQRQEGLWNMEVAVTDAPKTPEWAESCIYYAQALSSHGGFQDGKTAFSILKDAIPRVAKLSREQIETFCDYGIKTDRFNDIFEVLDRLKEPEYAFWIVETFKGQLDNKPFIYTGGRSLARGLRNAARFAGVKNEDHLKFIEAASLIEEQYSRITSRSDSA